MKYFATLVFCSTVFLSAHAQAPAGVKKFTLTQLLEQHQKQSKPWVEFINEETMFAGIYKLKAGASDGQQPHDEDELYYVLEGSAKLKAGDTIINTQKGSIIYVRAMIEHRFFDITKDLTVLVLFSKARPVQTDPERRSYSMDEVEKKRNSSRNVWGQFHRGGTMNFGLYMLPKSLGGDSTLTHRWDEINIVTAGNAKFSIDDYTMSVQPGDIIFVPKGKGHHFHDLKNDFDALILFEKKSLEK